MRTATFAARSKPVTRARPEHPLHEVQLNLRVRGLAPSATVAINDRSNELRMQGKEIFKLGLGQSPFPVPSPVVEALRRHAAEKAYLPVQGLRELRETIAAHHCRTFGAAVLNALHSHRDLKLHTGVFSDSLLRLMDAGSMDLNGPLLTGVAAGSGEFYERLKAFPGIQYAPVTQTHSSEALAGIKCFFTINSAIEVDLQGNLNAEYLGDRRYSGRGGLPDFVSGGHLSAGGASIIVLPSSHSNGTKSRIVKELVKSATVPGHWVDYVITEHGCASLNGKNSKERAAALCAIAAPGLKDELCQ